jgi:hypothetical protein
MVFAGIVWPNQEHVDAGVSVLFEETNLTLTVDDLTMLMTGVVLRVPLTANEFHLVYVYLASVLVPYVITNFRTLAKVEQIAIAHSTVHPDGSRSNYG